MSVGGKLTWYLVRRVLHTPVRSIMPTRSGTMALLAIVSTISTLGATARATVLRYCGTVWCYNQLLYYYYCCHFRRLNPDVFADGRMVGDMCVYARQNMYLCAATRVCLFR